MKSTILDDKNVNSFIELGQVHMHLRHYRQAADAYQRGLSLDLNNVVCAYNLGAAYQRLGDMRANEYYAKAIAIFEQAPPLVEKRELANQYEAMSRAYLAVGNIEKAVHLLENAVEFAKELPSARIFSCERYEYVSQDKFIAEAFQLLQQVRRRLSGGDSTKVEGEGRLP